ncbi:MAG TPA: ATP synthase F1 subunit delta [Candidatus Saccharimonadales bacterium]|nr:ATP synthase F1 subunit delta [Candidatus Saccharimonadales bacterium]
MNSKVSRRVIARTIAAKLLAEPDNKAHWLQVLAAYVIDRNMAEDVDLLINDIAHELYDQDGLLLVTVTSARALSDSLKEDLTRTLQASTGANQVELQTRVDPNLLGGLIAKTPDAQLDASVRTKLKQLASL